MDFKTPQETLSINGFPITFRPVKLADNTQVWVPRGISRNEVSLCWRIYVVSEHELYTRNVHDSEHGYSAEATLSAAFDLMQAFLSGAVSRFVVDQRERTEGIERDPLVDSGVTGVVVSRSTRNGYKTVPVTTNYSLRDSSGRVRNMNYYVGSISERADGLGRSDQQQKFQDSLRKAIDVRRFYNRLRSQGIYPTTHLRHEDVPADIKRMPVDLPDYLDIEEILDSYMATPWTPIAKTTGGDPEALAAQLQKRDLSTPHKQVYLNGFGLRFHRRTYEGKTLYLPKELYRARGEWRVRIFCVDRIFTDAVTDEECEHDIDAALHSAWTLLISEIRQSEAPVVPENYRPAKIALLETGIRAVSITGLARTRKTDGQVSWSFNVGILQTEADGRERRITLATWALSQVTDDQIWHSLRYAAAASAYRYHLLARGVSPEKATLRKDSPIPDEFWPDAPPCPITVDDLTYHAEQRSKLEKTTTQK
ncbi:hypothetical protein [Marinobacter shengliensis]|uniref:hypothetical protein n=1 Tax=Marinobacter shengliensis TaxID=1389223 RepID=UPI0011096BCF|nr:hypothetical protein [Marinobacter shengliensis]